VRNEGGVWGVPGIRGIADRPPGRSSVTGAASAAKKMNKNLLTNINLHLKMTIL
jgi:hypothetical protein